MPQTSSLKMWKLLFCSIVCISFLFAPEALRGKNAPVSNWLVNVSEGLTGSGDLDTAAGAWSYLTSAATQISAGDMDGDGIDDLIGLWSGSGVWVKYSATGQWAYLASSADWIAAGDFNADGKKDLAGIWGSVIYVRDSATAAWTVVSSGANMLTAGDLDGDSKDDLIANWPGNAVWVRYSSCELDCGGPAALIVWPPSLFLYRQSQFMTVFEESPGVHGKRRRAPQANILHHFAVR